MSPLSTVRKSTHTTQLSITLDFILIKISIKAVTILKGNCTLIKTKKNYYIHQNKIKEYDRTWFETTEIKDLSKEEALHLAVGDHIVGFRLSTVLIMVRFYVDNNVYNIHIQVKWGGDSQAEQSEHLAC